MYVCMSVSDPSLLFRLIFPIVLCPAKTYLLKKKYIIPHILASQGKESAEVSLYTSNI